MDQKTKSFKTRKELTKDQFLLVFQNDASLQEFLFYNDPFFEVISKTREYGQLLVILERDRD